ncbi:MAG TPA: nucleoside-diphosphate sugar epimerase/dehydratase [Smithella sp.]|jgi:FlaA1/EpsC-like NDP-sugar epimerase|nr:polysaccharide biosynthesis protein [Syntrophaceae bacterium]HNQ66327.1 nucleoside-diphosphate sugar epimerase/dehydratase [Smithella sp.]HNZ65718.1 nucleoside-diphosphate sugar epimerase/dehydratase [Smithella sp.]HOE33692.1 nucleoside-diphosphate sugar epimerase/dehydratase [Smithella sp.]HOO36610.1 nucleoside-diphosphate sugar epimerase/dehydratase [Smithella sp.]
MYAQFKNPNFYLMVITDVLLFTIALYLSYFFRFDFNFANINFEQIGDLLFWILPLKVFIFFTIGLYRGMWRYTSVKDFWLLIQACFIATVLIMVIILTISRFSGYSRSIFFIDGIFTFVLTGGVRMAIRSFFAMFGNQAMNVSSSLLSKTTRVLIVGAGDAGEKILREINDNYKLNYEVVGLIDDDEQKQGRTIHGVRVLGPVDRLPKILKRETIHQILIAVPSASGDRIRRIVETCQQCNLDYKILPGIGDLIDGRVSVKLLRDISYEDLLGRSPVQLNVRDIRNYLDDKTILITGCGGSIGSELCRQVVKYQPHRLILLDSSESNLFNIQMEIINEHFFRYCEAILGHVQDEALMNNIFEKHKPEVVFHAAAYKHVPMMEKNPWQAVLNNIMGSRVAMEMAIKHHVERFVLVSTDKAVRPTNVMGASKRVTELIMQCQQGNGTRFMAVRFGNVIGSSGSVIPLFRRQIEQGGPVTVTHPEINRFFMTIPEAAQMILQAGTMGEGGEIFILRMGTPIKIAEMARDLIRLSGKEPDVDIKIVFTGLREGEKLYEELITVGEDIMPTSHKKVMVLQSNGFINGAKNSEEAKIYLYNKLDQLAGLAAQHDARGIKIKLKEIVPEYTPQENESVF